MIAALPDIDLAVAGSSPAAPARSRLAGGLVLAVLVVAGATLGFWLAASGDAVGAVLVAAGAATVALPAAACPVSAALVVRPAQRAAELDVPLRLGRIDRVVVHPPDDPLRSTVFAAFRRLDDLEVRTVLLVEGAQPFGEAPEQTLVVAPGADELWNAVDAIRFGRQVRRLVHQNLALAAVATAVLLPVAAAGRVPPLLVALAAVAVAGIVVTNSLRIRRFRSLRPPAHRRVRSRTATGSPRSVGDL